MSVKNRLDSTSAGALSEHWQRVLIALAGGDRRKIMPIVERLNSAIKRIKPRSDLQQTAADILQVQDLDLDDLTVSEARLVTRFIELFGGAEMQVHHSMGPAALEDVIDQVKDGLGLSGDKQR